MGSQRAWTESFGLLLAHASSFCLWQKKFEHDRYPWPMTIDAARQITPHQVSMLLDGIDFWQAHTQQTYERVS